MSHKYLMKIVWKNDHKNSITALTWILKFIWNASNLLFARLGSEEGVYRREQVFSISPPASQPNRSLINYVILFSFFLRNLKHVNYNHELHSSKVAFFANFKALKAQRFHLMRAIYQSYLTFRVFS